MTITWIEPAGDPSGKPDGPLPAQVCALTTTRHGGVSTGPYAGLNLALHVGDDPSAVEENRRRLQADSRCERIQWLNQVHGTEVLVVDRPIDELPRGAALSYDASVTNRTDLILSVRTADCVPIILYAPDAPAVGAVHAGWRGTQAGTVTAAIDAMQGAFHCRPREMMAVIGPCIHACCYQVDGELYKQFQERFGSEAVTVLGDSTYVDLVAVNRLWMIECGVLAENIDVLDYCTMCREEMFFSYRREAGRAGRQLAYVKL